MLEGYARIEQPGSEIYSTKTDRPFAEKALVELSCARKEFEAYLSTTLSSYPIRLFLAHNRAAFDGLVADVLKVSIERPSSPRRIAQSQRMDMVLLSPAAYSSESAYVYVPDDFERMICHELVHVVQELLSPNIEKSPLWWDEGLAVYLSNQWAYKSQFRFREPVLEAVQDRRIPPLVEVLSQPAFAYTFGWTLVQFIEKNLGRNTIVQLVKSVSDGNVLGALDPCEQEFEKDWKAWLLKRS